MAPKNEHSRILDVYARRDDAGLHRLYEWHRPEVLLQRAEYAQVIAPLFRATFGESMAEMKVLDVGCGTGRFLRLLIDWGCAPCNLHGTELIRERLDNAKAVSPSAVQWHLADLDAVMAQNFDLVSAHTVFSSILDTKARQELALQMLAKLKPGGWVLIFDFRYNNPRNPNVRSVSRGELAGYFSPTANIYRSLHLAPPIARRLAPFSPLLCCALARILPFLRSHFVMLMQKG